MKRRVWKKQHLKYLADITYEISLEPKWREMLLATPFSKKFRINSSSYNGLSVYLVKEIRKRDLRYFVSVVPHSETIGWEDWDPSLVYFKFEAEGFPEMVSFSANTPNSK
ncbi:hypothetical protein [Paenibacillus sp. ATY16]|uniref:hypothetical protein n=1 Tax=Paenibacillus sp. ATY16 TaxID=1759312 RepID=UPI00200C2E1D|nr:hypothetical protein [Paenibacillus sp. ATY16]MCK9860004.1 hypothetical protein [Paenibacillus sp. ATY16]